MPSQWTFNVLDGAGVIGGTKILIRSGNSNFLLDFGMNFSVWNNYFEEYLKPRSTHGLLDAAELGLLPPIPNLYRPDYSLPGINYWKSGIPPDFQNLRIDAIFVTHAHLDHCGYLSYVRKDVSVVSSLVTAFLMKAIQDVSKSDFEKEICYLIPREEKDGLLSAVHYKTAPSEQRKFHTIEPPKLSKDAVAFWENSLGSRQLLSHPIQQLTKVGPINLRSYEVDHSIPGCLAFAFETDVGWIVYTGDLRLHGAYADRTRTFANEVSKLSPRILFCEGTRVSRLEDENITEKDVRERISTIVRGTPGLVIADFGSRNIERLCSFREVALETNRKLVLMIKDIHLLKAVHLATQEGPDPRTDAALLLYNERKARDDTAHRTVYAEYEKKLIGSDEISKRQGDFIVCFSFWDLNELIDIRPKQGCVYIYSSSEAYGEEQRADIRRLRNWLQHFDITPLGVPDPDTGVPLPGETGLHASGHATARDLLEMIQIMKPKTLVPVHTEMPEFFVQNCAARIEVSIPKPLEPANVT